MNIKETKQSKIDSLICVEKDRGEWKNSFTLKARFYMRVVSFLLPGILKIKIINK